MMDKWPKPGRMPRLVLVVAICFTAVGLALTLPAMALPSLFGARLFYTGGDVTVHVLHSDTAYDEVLQLRSALTILDVTDNSKVGSHVTLTQQQLADMGIGLGDELQFGIHVRNTAQNFFLGPGGRNADGLDHAYLRSGRAHVYVGFEDLFGGGDRDYNDVIFRFSGVTTSNSRLAPAAARSSSGAVPEPASLLLLLTGIGLLGFAFRRR